MNGDTFHPSMIVLWLWLLLAPVVGVLVDAGRLRRDVRHRRPVTRDDGRQDLTREGGLDPMTRPAAGVAR